MNILVLNWRDLKHPEAGGAEVHFQELFRRLVAKGHRVTLLTTGFPNAAVRDEQDGITVYRWGHTYTFNWEAPFLVRTLLKRERFDCIVDDVNKLPFFSTRWFPGLHVCAFFHHLFGKTVFELTSFPLACYVLFLERMSAWGYRHVRCCTVSKSTEADLIAHGFIAKNIRIIENSVDTDTYVPSPPHKNKEPGLLLFMGRLKRYKNISLVLEAVQRLTAKGRGVRFVVVGTGDDEEHLREKARSLGIEDRVDFKGFISTEEKIRLLQRATVFVNPSFKEGWGIANIEANACGTAVVANDAPGLRDSVKHGETGLLYRENSLDDLLRCLELVLDDPDKRMQLEQGGRRWAESFSWDSSAQKVEQWLMEVAGRA